MPRDVQKDDADFGRFSRKPTYDATPAGLAAGARAKQRRELAIARKEAAEALGEDEELKPDD